ncbi:MAG: hypothetical protein P4L50_09460 [Anaerolineaceae bacterium]|nr:hypothetical protein [Anaerolineaceae bacterium]
MQQYQPVTQLISIVEYWRFPPMAKAEAYTTDHDRDVPTDEFVASVAKFLSVPQPYQWDLYGMPSETIFSTVRDYYASLALSGGFRVGEDRADDQGAYILTLYKNSPTVQRVYVQFWEKTDQSPALIMVIYQGF